MSSLSIILIIVKITNPRNTGNHSPKKNFKLFPIILVLICITEDDRNFTKILKLPQK